MPLNRLRAAVERVQKCSARRILRPVCSRLQAVWGFVYATLFMFLQRLCIVGGYLSAQQILSSGPPTRQGAHITHGYSRGVCVICALPSMQFCNLCNFVYIRFVCLNIFGACILKRPLRVQLMANGCRILLLLRC